MSKANEMMREANEIRTTDQRMRGAVGHFAAALTMARRAPDYFRARTVLDELAQIVTVPGTTGQVMGAEAL